MRDEERFQEEFPPYEPHAILVDTTKCTGCRACQLACKEWHNREPEETKFEGTYENPLDLSSRTWIRVQMRETRIDNKPRWLFRPEFCMHCEEAACEDVCPVPGCITKDPDSGGAVVLDERLCVGCLYCVFSCPFGIPRYEPERRVASKCTRCYDRSSAYVQDTGPASYKSNVPYCVAACPTGALQFGLRKEMAAIAGVRIQMLRRKHLKKRTAPYLHEYLGGLGTIYVLETPDVQVYGLPHFPRMPAAVRTWQGLWKPLTYITAGVAILFWLLHYALVGPVGVKVVEAPEEEERELTEEEWERMVRAKRRAGKAMRDLPKGYRPRKRKKSKKGLPPGRRSRLPGKRARREEEEE